MRRSVFGNLGFAVCIAAAVSAHAFAEPAVTPAPQARAVAAVLQKLGIALADEVVARPQILAYLNDLKRKACDKKAVLGLAQALDTAGHRRQAGEGLLNFARACGGPEDVLQRATEILLQSNDGARALEAADELVRRAPKSSYAIYLRGTAREAAGETEPALADYASAIELYGRNKRSIPLKLYQAMADVYARLGRFCEAATPIRIWVSYDPINRDTVEMQRKVADYQERGKCVGPAQAQSERYPLRGGHTLTVPAEINGVRGMFVLDTGASFVSVRPAFAERARLSQSPLNQVMMNTANGPARATLSRAERISVGKLSAVNVPVVVLPSAERGFGNGVDGLLGMSFLSRFDVRMTGGFIEIATRRRGY